MIKIEHLVKYYGQTCAVDDISFEVGEGEIVGLLGPNGAGKSTTMNILTGCLSSTSGRALIDGVDILSDPLRAKRLIGYLPEQPPLYLDMTVGEYLGFLYELKRCRLDREAHLDEVCGIVRIGDMKNRLIRSLSKGYRQRVGIAGALVGNPKVIIFDEPTVGLDPKQIIEIRNLIRSLGKEHTVILSTHILQEVQAVCDRIVIINKGRIVADERTDSLKNTVRQRRRFRLAVCGPQREVLAALRERPGVLSAEVGTERDGEAYTYVIECDAGSDLRKNLFYSFAERGWAIVAMEAAGLSLEDIFLSVVDKSDGRNDPELRTGRRTGKDAGTGAGQGTPTGKVRREDTRRRTVSAGKDEQAVADELLRASDERRKRDENDGYRDEL